MVSEAQLGLFPRFCFTGTAFACSNIAFERRVRLGYSRREDEIDERREEVRRKGEEDTSDERRRVGRGRDEKMRE